MLKDLFQRVYLQYESSPHATDFEGFAAWLMAQGHSQKATRSCCRRLLRVLAAFDGEPVAVFSSERLHAAFAGLPRKGFVGTERLFRRYLAAEQRLAEDAPCEPRLALLEQYLTRLVRLRGLAPATITYDRWALRDFLTRTLQPHQTPADLTATAIDAFFARRRPELARRTFYHSVCVVRALLRHAFERGSLRQPLHRFELPRTFRFEQPLRALRWSDVESLLDSVDRTTPLSCRDHAILHLMSHHGLRPGEVASLRLECIDPHARTLRVCQSKTHSTLTLPLSAKTLLLLRRYVDRARPQSYCTTLFVTMGRPHAAMTASAVSARFKAAARRSGSPIADASAYALRHTFAMRLLGSGVGIKSIGDLMGHHSLASTSAYLRIQMDMLRGVALECRFMEVRNELASTDVCRSCCRLPRALARARTSLSTRGVAVDHAAARVTAFRSQRLDRGSVRSLVRSAQGSASNSRRKWAQLVRRLCLFRQRSEPECFVSGTELVCRRQPYVIPVIVSDAQVARMIQAADSLEPSPNSPLRAAVMRMAVVLLYTTGMRLGELRRLALQDVEDDGAVLRIRESKFQKSRLLPLSSSTQAELRRYVVRRAEIGFDGRPAAALLCNHRRRGSSAYTMRGLQQGLTELFIAAGTADVRGRLPRIHDLRHSFAVQALARWYRRGADVQVELPKLAMYMGHVSIESTAHYLRWTEQIAELASDRFERQFAGVIGAQS